MANTLTLTAAVSVANISKLKVGRVTELDEDNNRMVVEVVSSGGGGVVFAPMSRGPWRLAITNGTADALVAHPAPAYTDETLIAVSLAGAGLATAFTTALTAYRAAGADKRGNLLTALQGLNGVVQGTGPLGGTTIPILPAGAVS